jgi:hypothetical protein
MSRHRVAVVEVLVRGRDGPTILEVHPTALVHLCGAEQRSAPENSELGLEPKRAAVSDGPGSITTTSGRRTGGSNATPGRGLGSGGDVRAGADWLPLRFASDRGRRCALALYAGVSSL